MTNENVKTETSVELQEFRTAVLNGINWTSMTDSESNNQLHIGQIANYQIYLSESPNFLNKNTGIRTYTMSLWEMTAKTKEVPCTNSDENLIITRPGFVQLISDITITAMDIHAAKVETVNFIREWSERRLDKAVKENEKFKQVFDNLPKALSDKIVAARGADSVKTLNVSNAAITALLTNGINVIGQIAEMTVKDFRNIKGLNGSRGQEVLFAMKSLGIIMNAE